MYLRFKFFIALGAAAVLLAAALAVSQRTVPSGTGGSSVGEYASFLHSAVSRGSTFFADLNADSTLERYLVADGSLAVIQNGAILWENPDGWWVDHALAAEATNEGYRQLVLSVWKSGNYGSSQPFWVEENDPAVRNHLFVMKWQGSEFVPVWQSSNLSAPNCELEFLDVNGDGEQELVVAEGEYGKGNECEGRYLAVWKWHEWGFYNEWRSVEGHYQGLPAFLAGLEP